MASNMPRIIMLPKTANSSKAKSSRMTKNDFCQLWLTCANEKEATKITKPLLAKRLVACIHKIPVSSSFRWQGKIDSSKEVLLVMDSHEDLFDEVEREVAKLHSYDTFVLESVNISKISKKAQNWLKSELI